MTKNQLKNYIISWDLDFRNGNSARVEKEVYKVCTTLLEELINKDEKKKKT